MREVKVVDTKRPSDLIHSVDRAIDILELISESDGGLGVTEISERLQLPKSTAFRLLSTLSYKGLVKKDESLKKYKLGIKLFQLGSEVFNELELRDEVRPFLEELVKEINETGHFVVEEQGEVIYIDKVESTHAIRQYSRIGRRVPLHCTGVGKAFLAFKSEEEIERLIEERGLQRFTANTITDYEALEKELNKIRENGFAIDNEEIQEHLMCVAAPIFNYLGEVVGAISIAGPKVRMGDEDNIKKIAARVKETAQMISARLGYRVN